jgi:hypothetical protein
MVDKRLVEKAKLAVGRNEYLRYLNKETITMGQAVKAKCFDCCAYYEDGKVDCTVRDCPLYPWMPFGKGKESRPKKERTEAQERAIEALKKRKRINPTTEKSLTAGSRRNTSTSDESAKSGEA